MKCVCNDFFLVLSNKTRLKILHSLRHGKKTVNEITESTELEQSLVSHNLALLKKCNFVFVEKSGKQRFYSLNKETIVPVLDLVEEHIKKNCRGFEKCVVK